MTWQRFVMLAAAPVLALALGGDVQAGGPFFRGATNTGSWNGGYTHTMYGAPVALVVPPSARRQGGYRWGVPSTYTTRINSQFEHNGTGAGGSYVDGGLSPTPIHPSDTNQFGVYYVRGPRWKN